MYGLKDLVCLRDVVSVFHIINYGASVDYLVVKCGLMKLRLRDQEQL